MGYLENDIEKMHKGPCSRYSPRILRIQPHCSLDGDAVKYPGYQKSEGGSICKRGALKGSENPLHL